MRRTIGPAALLALSACAHQSTSVGVGGTSSSSSSSQASTSAATTTGNGGATSSSSSNSTTAASSTTSSSTGMNLCGNGTVDPGEQCDGTNFNGKACTDYGLATGTLACNSFCQVVLSGCMSCAMAGCQDPNCSATPTCTDPCSVATPLTDNTFTFNNSLTGKSSAVPISCAPAGAQEIVFAVTAASAGTLTFTAQFPSFQVAVSARTTCNSAASEISCVKGASLADTSAVVPVTANQTVYFIVATADGNAGTFDVQTSNAPPETLCTDFIDNDGDGLVDCDDPTSCQTLPACVPGATTTGLACTANTNCAAAHNNPVCLTSTQGFPNGYCSQFCNASMTCPVGDQCANLGISADGVCMHGCTMDTDCQTGLSCVNRGLATKVCDRAAETLCNDYIDNNNNGATDCDDPSECQQLPACTPGAKPVGQPCVNHNECAANMNDPFCIDQAHENWPAGYCSEFCKLTPDDCPTGNTCTNLFAFGSGHGVCLKNCVLQTDCRSGYTCTSFGGASSVCSF